MPNIFRIFKFIEEAESETSDEVDDNDRLELWKELIDYAQTKINIIENRKIQLEELSDKFRDKILDDLQYNEYALSIYKVNIEGVIRKKLSAYRDIETGEIEISELLTYLLWHPSAEDLENSLLQSEHGGYILVYYYLPERYFNPGPVKVFHEGMYTLPADVHDATIYDNKTVTIQFPGDETSDVNMDVILNDVRFTIVPDIPKPPEFRSTKAYR